MGAGKYEICDKQTKKSAAIGAVLAMGTEFLFAVSAPALISFFTQDKSMVELVQKLMFIDIALEAGRVTNLVYGNALKTSGDAVFPVILGAVFMFLCAAGGTYLLGIQLHLAVVGAYIGLTADECRLALNEIYARHGRKFNDPDYRAYFNSKSWYNGTIDPDDFDDTALFNKYELANRDYIIDYEKRMGYK